MKSNIEKLADNKIILMTTVVLRLDLSPPVSQHSQPAQTSTAPDHQPQLTNIEPLYGALIWARVDGHVCIEQVPKHESEQNE